MRISLVFFMLVLFEIVSNAQTSEINYYVHDIVRVEEETDELPNDNNRSRGQNDSHFLLGFDLQNKYIWRGMEMMTEEAAPVLFPSIGYAYKGIYAYVMGGYSVNGKYAEVDLGVSYTYKWLTIGLNNYYYPTIDSVDDQYFTFDSKKTGHWWEGVVTIAPENIPAKLTVSNFFAGADKNLEGKQAYSTYAEIGTWYDFTNNNQIALNVGAAFNKSCYNGYEHNFGVCNIELKYTHSVEFKSGWTLPLSVSYIINPVREKSFVNLTANFAF